MINKTKKILIALSLPIIICLIVGFSWFKKLNLAHSTFENYYKFRGCIELVEKTDTYGLCKIKSGETIKIVKYENKWYLDGDLPPGAKISDNSSNNMVEKSTEVKYINSEYGFTFTLPVNWAGYIILKSNWNGNIIDNPSVGNISGPEIIIRNSQWTSDVPRQDIPIMIFTLSQWDQVQQEKISLGAAPIPPSELGRNSKYVFAIPARYNFAYPLGFEEVEKILENKPLSPL